MAKISIILPDNLDEEVREYAQKEDLNLTNSCIILLKKGLEAKENEVIGLRSMKNYKVRWKIFNKNIKS